MATPEPSGCCEIVTNPGREHAWCDLSGVIGCLYCGLDYDLWRPTTVSSRMGFPVEVYRWGQSESLGNPQDPAEPR